MKKYRILDLDNCISDDSWRIQHIDWSKSPGNARYREYHLLCGFDRLVNPYLLNPPSGVELIFFTGRPLLVHGITREWLSRNNIHASFVLMRNNDCELRSMALKSQHLDWLVGHYDISTSQILDAYDDHPEIVGMYRERGLTAHQVTAHDMSAYHNPLTKETVF